MHSCMHLWLSDVSYAVSPPHTPSSDNTANLRHTCTPTVASHVHLVCTISVGNCNTNNNHATDNFTNTTQKQPQQIKGRDSFGGDRAASCGSNTPTLWHTDSVLFSASFLTVHLHAAAGIEGRGPSEESRRRGCSKHRRQLPSSASPDGLHKVKPSITVITIPAHVTVFLLFLLITRCGACKAAQPRLSLSCPRLTPNHVQQRLPITAKQTQSATGN